MLFLLTLISCDGLGGENAYPDLVFLGWDENDQVQLKSLNAKGKVAQLTDLANGVLDYSVAPGGLLVAFSTLENGDSSAIWQMMGSDGARPTKMLDCPHLICDQPVWAPDGKRLIYERKEIDSTGMADAPYLWWLNMETGETRPIFEDREERGTTARFSPDGQWLSYFSPVDEGVYIYKLEDGRSQFFPNEIGMPVVWSPNSQKVIVPNLDLVVVHGDEGEDHEEHTHDFQSATHLFVADIETGDLKAVSANLSVEDGVPAWSPDSNWIAFGRRPSRTGAARQLWLMRSDGSEARALTEDPEINYGPPSWSPDGRYLLFQRFSLDEPESDPAVWLYDLETGEQKELAPRGMQPQWLD